MNAVHRAAVLIVLHLSASSLLAQEPPFTPIEKEHEWLKQFVGKWESISESPAQGDQPAMVCEGTITSRMLGDLWVISEQKADMDGTKFTAIQTIGYDPKQKKYIGTWVDSMLGHMWKYEGFVDESGKKLTLEAEGPDLMGDGKMAMFRDAYEFKSKDDILMTASMLGEDGKWTTFMTGHIRRKK